MKIFKSLLLLTSLGVVFSFTQNSTSTLPTSHDETLITWKGKKVTGSHEGTISLKSGALEYDSKSILKGGSFAIDMSTIAVTDLTGNPANNLRGHLLSQDFFNVEKHPEATFIITNVEKEFASDGPYDVTGDLTIKGITKELKFPVAVTRRHGKLVARAKIKVDRIAYDIKYGSGQFFENLGDKMIDDHFELNVTLVN